MKKFLALISALSLSATPVVSTVSCSSQEQSFTPANGWPPVEPVFIPIWSQFQKEAQEQAIMCMGRIFNSFDKQYMDLYKYHKDYNQQDADDFGVSNAAIDKIKDGLAKSQDMYDYEMYSLRLYYIESNLSYLQSNTHHRQLFDDEESEKLWAMYYFRALPFYTKGDIVYDLVNKKGEHKDHYTVEISYNEDENGFYQYENFDDFQNGEWDKEPKGNWKQDLKDGKFKPAVKLKKEYYSIADEIYKEVFGEGNKND